MGFTINYRIFFENKKQDVCHLCFLMEIDVVIYIFSNYFNSKTKGKFFLSMSILEFKVTNGVSCVTSGVPLNMPACQDYTGLTCSAISGNCT